MKLNINEIRKIIVEELQVLSEAVGPRQENIVTDFDADFDYAYFKGTLDAPAWWARGKSETQQKKLEDTSWFGRSPQFLGQEDQGFVWVKIPAAAQETLSLARPQIVATAAVPAEPASSEEEVGRRRLEMNITTRVDDVLRIIDVDVYGQVLLVLDVAARGDFGPEVAERAESLLRMTPTLSPLKDKFSYPGYEDEEMVMGAPLRAKIRSLINLRKIPTGGDMGHVGLVYNLLARAAGIPVQGGTSLEDAILGSLTGNADELKHQFRQAVLALGVVKGEVEGSSTRRPDRYVRGAFEDLDLITQGDRVRNVEDAELIRDRAALMIRAAERGAELARYGIDSLRGKLDSDPEVRELLAGIIPTDEESLRQFI